QAEDGIRDFHVTGVQTCALPISERRRNRRCCPFWCTSSVPAGQLACPDALSLTHDPKQRGLKLLARTVHLRKGLVETLEFLTAAVKAVLNAFLHAGYLFFNAGILFLYPLESGGDRPFNLRDRIVIAQIGGEHLLHAILDPAR